MRQLPVIYGGHDGGPRPATREQVCGALQRGVDPVIVARQVARGTSDLWGQCLTALNDAEPKPACAEGCASCCHRRVEVTALEVFLIARSMVAASSRQLDRVHAAGERHAVLSSSEHFLQQSECPFLDQRGACEIYEVRPLACRRAHSLDVRVCLALASDPEANLTIPVSQAIDWNTSALVLGYYEGMVHAGVPPHQYELAQAVSLALQSQDAEARWLRGEDVLAAAKTRDAETLGSVLGRPTGG